MDPNSGLTYKLLNEPAKSSIVENNPVQKKPSIQDRMSVIANADAEGTYKFEKYGSVMLDPEPQDAGNNYDEDDAINNQQVAIQNDPNP